MDTFYRGWIQHRTGRVVGTRCCPEDLSELLRKLSLRPLQDAAGWAEALEQVHSCIHTDAIDPALLEDPETHSAAMTSLVWQLARHYEVGAALPGESCPAIKETHCVDALRGWCAAQAAPLGLEVPNLVAAWREPALWRMLLDMLPPSGQQQPPPEASGAELLEALFAQLHLAAAVPKMIEPAALLGAPTKWLKQAVAVYVACVFNAIRGAEISAACDASTVAELSNVARELCAELKQLSGQGGWQQLHQQQHSGALSEWVPLYQECCACDDPAAEFRIQFVVRRWAQLMSCGPSVSLLPMSRLLALLGETVPELASQDAQQRLLQARGPELISSGCWLVPQDGIEAESAVQLVAEKPWAHSSQQPEA
eukprot:TRINITY_DN14616_c0_g1_i1.p1 TRINITY_DN14616_c0_g1~~TRINITY_DN14616_c0_g1_i1.p1  ORF type:complete len:368 (+),score=115.08 TRINITY_DN14616_c0_g1_i1:134-1237(+)